MLLESSNWNLAEVEQQIRASQFIKLFLINSTNQPQTSCSEVFDIHASGMEIVTYLNVRFPTNQVSYINLYRD